MPSMVRFSPSIQQKQVYYCKTNDVKVSLAHLQALVNKSLA